MNAPWPVGTAIQHAGEALTTGNRLSDSRFRRAFTDYGANATSVVPQAASFIRARIVKGTTVHADESNAWGGLHERFEMKRINHQEAYSFDGACTNQAEEYFSRLRRAEIGIHHHIAGAYLLRCAQESSWC
jgi:hypothetical protein